MTTLTLQPDDTIGFDSFIVGIAPTSNFGTVTNLFIGEKNTEVGVVGRGLIKFDLSSIPADATINLATLDFTVIADWSSNARTMRAYRLKLNWTESGVTWNKYDGTNAWGTAGATGANDIDTTSMGSCAFTATESIGTVKQFIFDNAEFTKLINGTNTNYGWLFKMDTEADDAYDLASSGHATAAYRPKLVVVYNEGQPVWW